MAEYEPEQCQKDICPRCGTVDGRPTWTVYPVLDIPSPMWAHNAGPPRVQYERFGCMVCDPQPWKRPPEAESDQTDAREVRE